MPASDMMQRHTTGAGEAARTCRRPGWVVMAAVAVMLLIAIGLPSGGSGQTPAAGLPVASPVASPAAVSLTPTTQMIVAGHATVAITDSEMLPAHFESAVGRNVQITVVNAGTRTHNFTMAAFEIDVDLKPGEAATFQINGPPLGDYPYFSDLPGDEALKGTMSVFI
jgi:hypothetical protein